MDNKKEVFLSYSHNDKDFAEKIEQKLRKSGIKVWWDKWEIKPGDSIIEKIFKEGLANCEIFLIILSQESSKSKWVTEELNSAIIRRMEGLTKIIPLLKENCEIPIALRALVWVDLSSNFDEGIRKIVKSIYEIDEKPPVGLPPDYIKNFNKSVGGLSAVSSQIGYLLLGHTTDKVGVEKNYSGNDIKNILPELSIHDINSSVEELEAYGLIKVRKFLGTAPFKFGYIEPTYALYLHYANDGLDFNPYEDIKIVATTVNAKKSISGQQLQELTSLQPLRINRAVSYLEDYGIVQVRRVLGTAPFTFASISATWQTQKFVKENCK